MDYEKLHKDTINKLQQMVNSGKITVETARGICADFVPESEDERIRKWLIEMVEEVRKANPTNAEHNGRCSKAIAWLEKQGEQNLIMAKSPQLGEQNPAWSEEDETILDNLIYALVNDRIDNNRDEYVDWLKSLRPQPKQEVDEQIETIAMHLDNCGNTAMAEILRSCNLRPQKRWKPSEEQINALAKNVEYVNVGCTQPILKALLEDLKKLKDEK